MKLFRFASSEFIPASHEDPRNPGVVKKVVFEKDDFPKGHIQMVNWAKLPEGKSFAAHYHEDMDECFMVYRGKCVMRVGDMEIEMSEGDAVVVEAKEVHAMENIGEGKVEYVVFGVSRGTGGKTIVVGK